MILGWKKMLPPEQHAEFDKVFEEIKTLHGEKYGQPQINIYLLNELIRIRTEMKNLKLILESNKKH